MEIFVSADENLLCVGNTDQKFLSLTTIFNIKNARNSFSSLTTDDKIFVTSDKNRTVCARFKARVKQRVRDCTIEQNIQTTVLSRPLAHMCVLLQ